MLVSQATPSNFLLRSEGVAYENGPRGVATFVFHSSAVQVAYSERMSGVRPKGPERPAHEPDPVSGKSDSPPPPYTRGPLWEGKVPVRAAIRIVLSAVGWHPYSTMCSTKAIHAVYCYKLTDPTIKIGPFLKISPSVVLVKVWVSRSLSVEGMLHSH